MHTCKLCLRSLSIFLRVIYLCFCQSLSITEEGRVNLVCILVIELTESAGNARAARRGMGWKAVHIGDGDVSARSLSIVRFSLFKLCVLWYVNQ